MCIKAMPSLDTSCFGVYNYVGILIIEFLINTEIKEP